MAPQSVRPYRDFLMPALHRRFTRACFYTLPVCYLIAVWMGDWKHFLWAWLPFGFVGIRALFLFIPVLLVYLLRVTQWHIGRRNTTTPLETLHRCIFTRRFSTSVILYSLSAFLYCEVYIWAQASNSSLETTTPGKLHERTKLNERPIYLRFLFIALALVQSALHLYKDYDHVEVRMGDVRKASTSEIQLLLHSILPLASSAGLTVSVTLFAGSIVYFSIFRARIWALWYSFMKQFINLGKTTKPTGVAPFIPLVSRFLVEGALLLFLWQFSNVAFNTLMAREPLKDGKPITGDSKDPNGSLLNGLKSKKEDNKNTAFWELALITERFDDRRKTIYGELDRSKGSTGKQISKLCLNELNQLVTRTKVALNPSYVQDETGKEIVKQDTSVTLVPRIVTPPEERKLLGPPIAPVTRLQRLEAAAADIAKQHSSPANTQDAAGRYVLRKGQDGFDEGRNKIGSAWDNLVESASQTPIGWLWRKSVRREANAWVFGSPYSRKMLIYNAITILTNLAVASLKEDVHGQFQNEVPDIVRAITAAIKALEDYAKALKTTIPEIEEPKTALKEALGKILGAFNEYLSTMGMTCTEIQEAKECLAKQMEEKRSR